MYEVGPPAGIDQGTLIAADIFAAFYEASGAIVLTPRCDLEWKADFLALCAVATPQQILTRRRDLTSKGRRRDFVESVLKGQSDRYHWLGFPTGFASGAIADFQLISSVGSGTLGREDSLAQLLGQYADQLATRYAAYMGRIGVVDLFTVAEREVLRNQIVNSFVEPAE